MDELSNRVGFKQQLIDPFRLLCGHPNFPAFDKQFSSSFQRPVQHSGTFFRKNLLVEVGNGSGSRRKFILDPKQPPPPRLFVAIQCNMQFGVGSNDYIEIADDIDTGRNAFKISRQRIFSGESFDFGCSRGIQKAALDIFGRQKRFPNKTRNFKSLIKMFRSQFTAVVPPDKTFQNIDQS